MVESLALHLEPLVALEQLAVELELMAFFVDSYAFTNCSNAVEFGFTSSCFSNFGYDFYFGYKVFFLLVFGCICLLGSFMHELIHWFK
jgi:hypothetical protein